MSLTINSPSRETPYLEWQGDVLIRIDPNNVGIAKFKVLGRIDEMFGQYRWQLPNPEDGWWKTDTTVRPCASMAALKEMMWSRYSREL